MRYGFPLSIHSTQGRNYESQIMTEMCKMLEIQKTRTSPRNPRCNGQVECFNHTPMRMIKVYLKGDEVNWDRHLGYLAGAYQGTVQESTQLSRNLIMFGQEVCTPMEIFFRTHHHESYPMVGEYVKLKERMQHAYDIAREHLGTVAKRNKGTL